MKTKEQILEEELSEDLLKILEQENLPEELRYFKRYVLDAMEEYGKELLLHNVSNNEVAVCDSDCDFYDKENDACWHDTPCIKYKRQTDC